MPTPTASAPSATLPFTAPAPPPQEQRILRRTAQDVRRELRVRRRAQLPAGSLGLSYRNTARTLADPLALLMEHRRRHGDVFTIRVLHEPIVWVTGAPGVHQVLVTDADAFSWREGRFRDLEPLLGDGMLNIDGDYHRQMRRLLLPAFHHRQVAAVADDMVSEAVRAADSLVVGDRIDLYDWTRELALRIAMRSLLGLASGAGRERQTADAFTRALHIHGQPPLLQVVRGPRTPYAESQRARRELDALIYDELHARRAAGHPGGGVLGMLLGATTGDGAPLPLEAVRDQAVTLLFAGHDTTTATIAFLFYELARHPQPLAEVVEEIDGVLGGAPPAAADLTGERLPVLERTIKETLRRWPAAWIGPRRTTRDVDVAGVTIPADVAVHYSSWLNHHLDEYFPDPLAFKPDRFQPEAEQALPKGAYIPFGGGSRMCLGKRFGEVEIRAIATVLLQRFHFEGDPSVALKITTTPTLGPAGGMWFTVRNAGAAR